MATLNDQQEQAVSTRMPNVLVSAGAGSGKTRVLTQRYIELITRDGLRLDQVLALTFTRKAAQEMRERIAATLEGLGEREKRRDLPRAPIGTIHGFCERVLREYALQAEIDPNFRVLDEAESHTLQEKALDSVMEAIWSGTQTERERIGRLMLDFPHATLRESVMSVFRTARTHGIDMATIAPAQVGDADAAAREVQWAAEELIALPGTPRWGELTREAAGALDELQEIFALPPDDFTWEHYDCAVVLQKSLTPSGGPKEAKAARDAVKAAMTEWLGCCLDRMAVPYLSALLTLLRRFAVAYRQAKDEQSLLDFEDMLLITAELLCASQAPGGAGERYGKQFRQVMVDEFQDTNRLQFRIIKAFQGQGDLFLVGDVKQAIYRFIGSDVRVFLDQEGRIAGMGESGQRIPMAVNYRTRTELLCLLNGLFHRLWTPEMRTGSGFIFEPLDAGAHFTPKETPSLEIAFWPGDDTSAADARDQEAAWIARRILQITGKLGEAPLQVTDEQSGEALASRDAACRDILLLFRASTDIARYEEALRTAGVPFYTVSGRGFYQAREVQDLVFMLRMLKNPLDDYSLAIVLRSPLVGVSDDTLYWLTRDWEGWIEGTAYPTDTRKDPAYGRLWSAIARVETLIAISEEERKALVDFRALVHDLQAEMPAGHPLDLLDMILARTDYTAVLLAGEGGEQRFANVQKLREEAAEFQNRGIFDLADFERYLSQLQAIASREASAPLDVEESDVVRLMTIHAAKGLEAPVVFLADCGREPNAQGPHFRLDNSPSLPRVAQRSGGGPGWGPQESTPRAIAVDERDHPSILTCKIPTPEDGWEQPAAYRRVAEKTVAGDRWEAERLLYVALTRAREHLICSGMTKYPTDPAKQTRYADILAHLLGLPGPVEEDAEITLAFQENEASVRIWSPGTLQQVMALAPPAQPPTLWDAHRERILAGMELPVMTDGETLERYARVAARMQPLPPTRREGPLWIGVSKLLCYNTCPRQYWFRYLLCREEIVREAMPPVTAETVEIHDDERERTDGTAFGQLLHAVMQRIDFHAPLADQLPALLEAAGKERECRTDENTCRRLRDCLERFAAMPICGELQRATTLHRELRLLAREGNVYVPGIIDVLVEDGNRRWILDYKTGRPSGNHLRQVAIYALGIEHATGIRPERAALVYLDEDSPYPLREERLTPDLLANMRTLIRTAGEGIRNEAYPPQTGRHCEYCPYAGLCPQGSLARAAALDNVNPVESE